MKVLKGYTKNQYRPKSSIVEGYVAEESIEFFSQYIETIKSIGLLESRHDQTLGGQGYMRIQCCHNDSTRGHTYTHTRTHIYTYTYIKQHGRGVSVHRGYCKSTIELSSTSLEKQSLLMAVLPKH